MYDAGHRKFPRLCPYKATQYLNAGIRKVCWCYNDGKHQTPDSLGNLLSHQQSWYPKGTIPFSQVAVTKPLPTVPMSLDDCEIMRGWASTVLMVVPYNKGLSDKEPQWQSLPEFMYQRQLDSGPKATFNFKEDDDSLSEDGPDQVIEREDMKHKTKLMNLMRAVTQKS